jgi:hypothetical protein
MVKQIPPRQSMPWPVFDCSVVEELGKLLDTKVMGCIGTIFAGLIGGEM